MSTAKKKLLNTMARVPILGAIVLGIWRAACAARPAFRPVRHYLTWIFLSKETTNYTYDITDLNRKYLAALIADIVEKPVKEILGYFQELESNRDLSLHLSEAPTQRSHKATSDRRPLYGRRLGWYALARAVRPHVIVETGVDKGLGACVLTAALLKNSKEGFPGQYYGTDINPEAGYLLAEPYSEVGKVLYGDSIESLGKLNDPIGFFVNDSDHSADYEAREYETIQEKLTPNAIIVGDNAHISDELLMFSQRTGRQFAYFREEPKDHWFPGAGVGIAFRRNNEFK